MAEHTDHLHVLRAFASLRWYEETIKFVFTFVAKTSELLLAAGIVISTANFLTDAGALIPVRVLEEETVSLPSPSCQEISSSHPQ